jgi:hypothetical protein
MDPGLDAELDGACLHGFLHPVRELLLRMLVGVGQAPRLAKVAERAPDNAHIGDVDVSVDHERDRLPRQASAQLISRAADLLNHRRPGLREQRRQLLAGQTLLATGARHRARRNVIRDTRHRPPATATPRDERPVAAADHIHHRVGDSF